MITSDNHNYHKNLRSIIWKKQLKNLHSVSVKMD